MKTDTWCLQCSFYNNLANSGCLHFYNTFPLYIKECDHTCYLKIMFLVKLNYLAGKTSKKKRKQRFKTDLKQNKRTKENRADIHSQFTLKIA